MFYSLHDEQQGGFRYYEAPGPAINADHPTPRFQQTSAIGVPSTLAARALPSNARFTGYGKLPKGSIVRVGGIQAVSQPSGGHSPDGLGAWTNMEPKNVILAALAGAATFILARKAIKLSFAPSIVAATGVGAMAYGIHPIKAAIVGILPP